MKKRFTSLSFENVKFIDLFFEYRTPRILSRFGKKKAREITPDAVRGFLADLRKEDLAASSINQHRTILCSVFNYIAVSIIWISLSWQNDGARARDLRRDRFAF